MKTSWNAMRYILALFSGTSLLSKYRQTGCRQSHDINIQRTLIAPCTLDGKLQGTYETWESPPVQKFSATEPRNLWFNFFWYFNISQSILKHTSLQLRFWNSRYARKFWRKFRDSNPSAITSHGPKHQLTKKTSTLGTSATTPRRFTKNPPPPPRVFSFQMSRRPWWGKSKNSHSPLTGELEPPFCECAGRMCDVFSWISKGLVSKCVITYLEMGTLGL